VYSLEFSEMAKQDMMHIAEYITNTLQNPSAAQNLSVKMFEATNRLTDFPYINPAHQSQLISEFEYRKLAAQNYIILYRIDENEKKVIIMRAVYARRDYEKILEV